MLVRALTASSGGGQIYDVTSIDSSGVVNVGFPMKTFIVIEPTSSGTHANVWVDSDPTNYQEYFRDQVYTNAVGGTNALQSVSADKTSFSWRSDYYSRVKRVIAFG